METNPVSQELMNPESYLYVDLKNMPKGYLKKKPGPNYTVCDVQRAVSDVASGLKTYRQASFDHKVPVPVLFNRIKGRKTSTEHIGSGRECDLSKEVEDSLEKCLMARADMGYPCDKKKLKDIMQQPRKESGREKSDEAAQRGWKEGEAQEGETI